MLGMSQTGMGLQKGAATIAYSTTEGGLEFFGGTVGLELQRLALRFTALHHLFQGGVLALKLQPDTAQRAPLCVLVAKEK